MAWEIQGCVLFQMARCVAVVRSFESTQLHRHVGIAATFAVLAEIGVWDPNARGASRCVFYVIAHFSLSAQKAQAKRLRITIDIEGADWG